MRITFLGTGTSHGIPRLACDCAVCHSPDPHDQRLRPSVLLSHQDRNVLVDATPDLRTQALGVNLRHLEAVLLTHSHADHMLGLDDLRVFTAHAPLPLWGSSVTLQDVARVFPYACVEKPAWAGMPHFALHPIEPHVGFTVAGISCLAVPLLHGRMTVYGFRFGRALAYLTDCNQVPKETIAAVRGVTVLVIDALRERPHVTHLSVGEALAIAEQVQPQLTLLTHICHEMGHAPTEARLPANVRLAYDGLRMQVDDHEWQILA